MTIDELNKLCEERGNCLVTDLATISAIQEIEAGINPGIIFASEAKD